MEVKQEMKETTMKFPEAKITGISFAMATDNQIRKASNSSFPISHSSQLSNLFLGLPLEDGKCESCGASEVKHCEGHFGYIELPIPIYHPSHFSELRRLLSTICLKCLNLKTTKKVKKIGTSEQVVSHCCEEASLVSISELRARDGAHYLLLKIHKSKYKDGAWNFLEKYGYKYGDKDSRPLLPSEVMKIMKKLPDETKQKLTAKGYFSQEGYLMQYLPVPPNCLSVPDITDGITVMSSGPSTTLLKKILRKVEMIKSTRAGRANFVASDVEAKDLQIAVANYLDSRGTSKASQNFGAQVGIKEGSNDSNKAWVEKIKTLCLSKGSDFSSRSVITGDSYIGVNKIGIPSEIAKKITFEERVTEHNKACLQKLVDGKLCLSYRDGDSLFSLKEGSKGHLYLRPGHVLHRQVLDGDIVFLNRPPTTHKHSLQAMEVYIHDDHTVKINPLICGPLGADFDGDCVHVFYPQSLSAKAEAKELFSVDKQLVSSHNGKLCLQLGSDSSLAMKNMFEKEFLDKLSAQQLGMFVSNNLSESAFSKAKGEYSSITQIVGAAFPQGFNYQGTRCKNEILASIHKEKGPEEVLKFLDALQPMLMESLFKEGLSLDLKDFLIPSECTESIQNGMRKISTLLARNEQVESEVDNLLKVLTKPISDFILGSSRIGKMMDSKSGSAMDKVVQQVGCLGVQVAEKGKLYSKTLVDDMASFCHNKTPLEELGVVSRSFFQGLDPFQEMVHSISEREVKVRSSRGLTEPGMLFKNLMAVLRDVIMCYDGTVRDNSTDEIIQFEYKAGSENLFGAGEPVGVLAATAISDPAYKAVLDSSTSSNSSWEMMKAVLLCPSTFKNGLSDRKVTLYLSDCDCGGKYCREKASYIVKNHLEKVFLKDIAVEFLIECKNDQQKIPNQASQFNTNHFGHFHLDKEMFQNLNISMANICEKVEAGINSFLKQKGIKKKAIGHCLKRLKLSVSENCHFGDKCKAEIPCLKVFFEELIDLHLDDTSHVLAHSIQPIILDAIIKGDPRISSAHIMWIDPDTSNWIENHSGNQNGEVALEILVEENSIKKSGDAWGIVMDSCLPVIHLIDTTRSTPNSINQVQEVFGISSASNQVVQHLSRSVSMVSKGVLKEHINLVANTMTNTGNLIGFNKSGLRALSKTSKRKLPFSEATLYTPKKCFEKAAEKCNSDSLSGIVSSCSWGKEVSVGTGSHFDILWDKNEVGKDNREGTNVYDFLQMLKISSEEKKIESACLGPDVDDMDEECAMSPVHYSQEPTFEDFPEIRKRNEPAFYGGSSQGGGNRSPWDRSCIQKKDGGSGSVSRWRANRVAQREFPPGGIPRPERSSRGEKSAQRDFPPAIPRPQTSSRGAKPFQRQQNCRSGGWGTSGAGDCERKTNNRAMFTSEEQDIFNEIEPIMLSIRRIINQSGYNDGVPLSAEDQKFIIENVFNHHPEKTAKMGVGINYVTVARHSSFWGSRCLYVVLKDGHREDFSYRKCLENLVKTNYPHLAQSFNGKYFQKPHPQRK